MLFFLQVGDYFSWWLLSPNRMFPLTGAEKSDKRGEMSIGIFELLGVGRHVSVGWVG